ncbi:outer membrane beta-barrel protein [Neptunitalea lumnitzerae]|uniref:TonB-dependent receptor n=1 Tax=Neptunitalea lumnitzerae TaxID=2965509 RepID=A0ABQ5MGD1_9FLAO|nr:outer membrane beta-barrel protein [Neptunitalea sp. Y10]GLB47967.1 TonB-dependent receptor [Neptunitalea sp. Y10]
MKLLFTTFFFLGVAFAFGQQTATLSCTVTSEDGALIPYGTLQITKAETTAPLYYDIVDGLVTTEALPIGVYTIEITSMGYKTFAETFNLAQDSTQTITLTTDVTQLEGVTVTSLQESMTYTNGVLTVKMEHSVLANLPNTSDVIAKLPGVIVSADKESINVLGKGSPILYLDHQRITIEQLNAIPVSAIEKIELLKSPSAKYEADGNAVLVITLKKDRDSGYQVQLKNSAALQHNFNNYFNSNAYIGFGKLSMQLSLGYNQLDHWESNTSKLTYDQEGFVNEYIALSEGPRMQVPGSVGISYNLNETDYISTQTNFTIHRDNMPISTQTTITANGAETYYDNYTKSKGVRDYITTNLNYYKQLTDKTNLFTGVQYTYKTRDYNNFIYDVTHPNAILLTAENHQKTDAEVFSAKADIEVVFNEKFQWESGLNLYTADTFSESRTLTLEQPDYGYDESTYAGYTTLKGNLKKLSFTAGLRLENNVRNGRYTDTNETVVAVNQTNLFPRVNANFEIDSMNNVSVNYARSIMRPSFSQANNIRVYINEYLDYVNNINLKPALRNELVLEYKHGRAGLYVVYYRNTNGLYYLSNYDADTDKLVTGATNVAKEDGYHVIVMVPFTHKIWESTNYLYGGLVDVTDANAQDMGTSPFFYFYSNNELKFTNNFSVGLSYYYMMKHNEGVRTSNGFSELSITANKKFNEHWSCFLYANDVLNTLEYTQGYTTNGIGSNTTYFTDNHGVGLSVTYTFGELAKKNFKNQNVDEDLDRVK